MTTDALRPRQRLFGDGWSVDVHDDGGLETYALRGESTSRSRRSSPKRSRPIPAPAASCST
jgi:hypothetical protein